MSAAWAIMSWYAKLQQECAQFHFVASPAKVGILGVHHATQ